MIRKRSTDLGKPGRGVLGRARFLAKHMRGGCQVQASLKAIPCFNDHTFSLLNDASTFGVYFLPNGWAAMIYERTVAAGYPNRQTAWWIWLINRMSM